MAETTEGTQAAGQMLSLVSTPANRVSSSPDGAEQEDSAERLRGIVALPHLRDVLFTDEGELDADALPHWRPHIMVDGARLADDDHE